MLKKRIIGSIAVLNGWAVQSISYNRYLPLGRPEVIAQNLDRWGADEILIQCIDRSKNSNGPDFSTLSKIANAGITTPLIYAGGIKDNLDAINVIKHGADRVMFDALLNHDLTEIIKSAQILGSQALLGCIPVSYNQGKIYRFNYLTKITEPLTNEYLEKIYSSSISELLLVDFLNEGLEKSFNFKIFQSSKITNIKIPILIFGGISTPGIASKILKQDNIAGVSIGNFLSYKENSIEYFKTAINNPSIRKHKFFTKGNYAK